MSISLVTLAGLLRALSVLASTAGFKEGDSVARVLAMAAFAVERGEAGRAELERLCAQIDEMVAQGRPPTDEEWLVLRGRSDAAHDAIQKAAEAAAPSVPEPSEEEVKDEKGTGKSGKSKK